MRSHATCSPKFRCFIPAERCDVTGAGLFLRLDAAAAGVCHGLKADYEDFTEGYETRVCALGGGCAGCFCSRWMDEFLSCF